MSSDAELADLIERADLVILVYGEHRAGLGPDMQARIVAALRAARPPLYPSGVLRESLGGG